MMKRIKEKLMSNVGLGVVEYILMALSGILLGIGLGIALG